MYGYSFNFNHGVLSSGGGGGGSYGALTQQWITATGESDSTILNALNDFETEITAIGLNKFYYLYPFVGGNSTKHSYNFLDTSAFQLTWYGGITHDANGYTPNGTSGYGDTAFNPFSSGVTKTDFGMTMYSRTSVVTTGNRCHVGVSNGASQNLLLELSGSWSVAAFHNSAFSWVDASTRKGMFTIVRNGANNQDFYKNGTYDRSNAGSTTSDINLNTFIGARNGNGSASLFSDSNIALQVAHKGLSSSDISALNTANTNFQTALSRFL